MRFFVVGTVEGQSDHFGGFCTGRHTYLEMKIYDEKTLDVYTRSGKLQTVSVNKLFQMISDGLTPTLSEQAYKDLKRLMWLTTHIFIQGDWFLLEQWPVKSTPILKIEKSTSKH